MSTSSFRNDKGAALIEFCLILPVLLVLVFAIIDFGRLIHARLIITNVTREGGNLASRDIKSGTDLIAMLRSSATPLDLNGSGRICISSIEAGITTRTAPIISTQNPPVCSGSLSSVGKRYQCGGDEPGAHGGTVQSPGFQAGEPGLRH